VLQWFIVGQVFDVFHDHRGLSQCRTSSFVSSCVGNISHGEDVREFGVVDLKCPAYTYEASIIDRLL